MNFNPLITLIIVGITYIGIAIGRWPFLKSNRATVALVGVGALLVFNQLEFQKLPDYLDFDTLILLFSMMIINANLKFAGFFDLASKFLLRTARTPRSFLALEIIIGGILSALFLNDTICLVFTPLIIETTFALRRNPLPYLIGLATAVNVGSVFTLTGNPQNMIIGISSGISYLDFAIALLPIMIIGLVIVWFVIIRFYRVEFRPEKFDPIEEKYQPVNQWMLTKTLIVVTGLLIAFMAGVPIALASFLAACILLITRRTQPHLVFAEFDWGLLVFFSGLFILSGVLETNGVTILIFDFLKINSNMGVWPLSLSTAILSNLVSNVPAVLLFRPVIAMLSNPHAGWITLAMAATFAGNLTLLGSVANLIVAEIASRWRITISFWEYTKAGFIITVLTMVTGTFYLSWFIW
jgi:Na+/H+ antiporter NhaD/arsenite permease-like protein